MEKKISSLYTTIIKVRSYKIQYKSAKNTIQNKYNIFQYNPIQYNLYQYISCDANITSFNLVWTMIRFN